MVLGSVRKSALPKSLLFGTLLALGPGVSGAAPVPDSARLDLMRAEAARWNHFRVTSALERHELEHLTLDSLGVILAAPLRRPAVIAGGPAPPVQSSVIRWSDIDRIDAGRSHAMSGFFQGALVGGMAGVTAGFIYANNAEGEAALGAVSAPIVGILLGGFVGASIGGSPKWETFYP